MVDGRMMKMAPFKIVQIGDDFKEMLKNGITLSLPPSQLKDDYNDCDKSPCVSLDSLPEVKAIEEALSLYKAVLPKVGRSTPKDALWMNLFGLKCTTLQEIFDLLMASDRVALELNRSNCLKLIKWKNLNPCNEFRCFFNDTRCVAISQRDGTVHCPFLNEKVIKDTLKGIACDFGVLDVYIDDQDDAIWIIDFEEGWDELETSPILLTWPEIKSVTSDDDCLVKLLKNEADCRLSLLKLNRTPT
jgi:hypothetical protein